MTFEDYWAEVGKLKVLPEMAIIQLPSSLSMDAKKKLMRLSPLETSEILNEVINEINRGSVEIINMLAVKKLKKMDYQD